MRAFPTADSVFLRLVQGGARHLGVFARTAFPQPVFSRARAHQVNASGSSGVPSSGLHRRLDTVVRLTRFDRRRAREPALGILPADQRAAANLLGNEPPGIDLVVDKLSAGAGGPTQLGD